LQALSPGCGRPLSIVPPLTCILRARYTMH
jgi:hypothetical protein